jgi:hypothetical protein
MFVASVARTKNLFHHFLEISLLLLVEELGKYMTMITLIHQFKHISLLLLTTMTGGTNLLFDTPFASIQLYVVPFHLHQFSVMKAIVNVFYFCSANRLGHDHNRIYLLDENRNKDTFNRSRNIKRMNTIRLVSMETRRGKKMLK